MLRTPTNVFYCLNLSDHIMTRYNELQLAFVFRATLSTMSRNQDRPYMNRSNMIILTETVITPKPKTYHSVSCVNFVYIQTLYFLSSTYYTTFDENKVCESSINKVMFYL